jgi:hypothetical protein
MAIPWVNDAVDKLHEANNEKRASAFAEALYYTGLHQSV